MPVRMAVQGMSVGMSISVSVGVPVGGHGKGEDVVGKGEKEMYYQPQSGPSPAVQVVRNCAQRAIAIHSPQHISDAKSHKIRDGRRSPE